MNRKLVEFLGSNNGRVIDESETEYHVELFSGAQMWCPKSDRSVTPCVARDFFWESWITAWFMREVVKHDNFIDVGANSGYYAALAVHEGLSVHAFEPQPNYIPILDKLNVKVYELGLSDSIDKAVLRIPGDLEGSATMCSDFSLTDYEIKSIEINVSTLEAVFPEPLPGSTLIKVDAEGMEQRIMRGSGGIDAVWMLEYTPGAYDSDFLTDMEAKYSLAWIDTNGEERSITPSEIIGFGDWLMLVLRPKN